MCNNASCYYLHVTLTILDRGNIILDYLDCAYQQLQRCGGARKNIIKLHISANLAFQIV